MRERPAAGAFEAFSVQVRRDLDAVIIYSKDLFIADLSILVDSYYYFYLLCAALGAAALVLVVHRALYYRFR